MVTVASEVTVPSAFRVMPISPLPMVSSTIDIGAALRPPRALSCWGAFSWRSHSGLDPDQQRLWWQSASSTPLGKQALNFGRFVDPTIDQALTTIKSNPDPAARKAATETVNKTFGQQVYNLWLNWTVWGIITQPYVHGVESHKLPDGSKGIGLAFAGRHELNQMWCDKGKCE